ncbi:hypothetical protein LXL04_022321 [Taraxacum kok-saghyz]
MEERVVGSRTAAQNLTFSHRHTLADQTSPPAKFTSRGGVASGKLLPPRIMPLSFSSTPWSLIVVAMAVDLFFLSSSYSGSSVGNSYLQIGQTSDSVDFTSTVGNASIADFAAGGAPLLAPQCFVSGSIDVIAWISYVTIAVSRNLKPEFDRVDLSPIESSVATAKGSGRKVTEPKTDHIAPLSSTGIFLFLFLFLFNDLLFLFVLIRSIAISISISLIMSFISFVFVIIVVFIFIVFIPSVEFNSEMIAVVTRAVRRRQWRRDLKELVAENRLVLIAYFNRLRMIDGDNLNKPVLTFEANNVGLIG